MIQMENIILTQTTRQELVEEILLGVQALIKDSKEKQLLESEWLTSKEVLSVLKITSTTLWNYDNSGLTKPQKVGNRKRYKKSDIIQILSRKEGRIEKNRA